MSKTRIFVILSTGILTIIAISCISDYSVRGAIFIAWLFGLGFADYFASVYNSENKDNKI